MSYSYVLLELAQQEYEITVEWYASKSIKAAENFIAELENTLQLICNNPKRWRNEYKHYRELGVKRYPYVVIYSVEEDIQRVIVSAIFHTGKNPKKKYRKIK
jgi:plasmid stabilization system protein ParE